MPVSIDRRTSIDGIVDAVRKEAQESLQHVMDRVELDSSDTTAWRLNLIRGVFTDLHALEGGLGRITSSLKKMKEMRE